MNVSETLARYAQDEHRWAVQCAENNDNQGWAYHDGKACAFRSALAMVIANERKG